jgi:uncharacterized protein (DUF1501 family)
MKHTDKTTDETTDETTTTIRAANMVTNGSSDVGCDNVRYVDGRVDRDVERPVVDEGAPIELTRRNIIGGLVASAVGASIVGVFGSTDLAAAATRKVRTRTNAQPGSVAPSVTSPSAVSAVPQTPGTGILVVLTLYGGNDGLNTIVPNDPTYLSQRGALAYQPNETLALDTSFGMNPSMTGLKGLWDQKRVAIVHGVGYANPSRSHFRSMDIWQSGASERVELSGWLGRWHDATGSDPLRMINIGASLPRYMVALKGGGGAALPNGTVTIPGGKKFTNAFAELGRGPGNELGPLGARLASNFTDLQRVVDQVGPILKGGVEGSGTANLEGGATASGLGNTVLDRQFDEVARLIKGGAPTRAYGVALGGFDTHATERDQHRLLWASVDKAVTNFVNAMAADPRGANVSVLIYSEFGRRVAANLSNGTDHGAAAPVLVVGPAVKGGHFGDPPNLTDLDAGDIKFTTDFRRVYATLLGTTLAVDPAAVLGQSFAPLPFL